MKTQEWIAAHFSEIHDLLLFLLAESLVLGFMIMGDMGAARDLSNVLIGAVVMYLKGKPGGAT